MRMIVEAFKEALETGLEQPGQVVVRQAYLRNYQGHGRRGRATLTRYKRATTNY